MLSSFWTVDYIVMELSDWPAWPLLLCVVQPAPALGRRNLYPVARTMGAAAEDFAYLVAITPGRLRDLFGFGEIPA